ncbi:bifunctional diaminohydroxyphosphoribosylaminopyrimidine deaminase/5-amino-6-(5-phosphoribosylamino)uracil reductase RibD [Geminocystis sp. NIES-3709]|uniref:bifunctional diaminohydroxyphosphoribosylaminopyrimidine deaminase/5-amino-6-(5-phosphoribosylamino)uracil reductase RibD n=1 Tax=Geminocystis sp. NIES-3709 TaxID=1617448 RepID=UPI0005FC5577|nr:bifunctional diaminohydroxyphosphoribosylaminopyrimidine deaminase/5-amino-6-(5-phosphoribosylamino)uracil reductase RibD [Geminocystis sp. NIES-3709]BAQ66296.1 diaminohydroxyphosphoribosylaminopyrimidine deaminase [Geminocystis sp. NIES-3709]
MTDFDRKMMQRCLELAKKAQGKTSPNPLVGSIVVKNGQIIGEGFHPQAGQPHAEVFALQSAGSDAQNATVYVNLEPCNHYGRTPPCTEALINAQVKKVVIGSIDSDNRVSGSGIKRLMDAGIDVIVGVEEDACLKLNEAFFHRVKYQRPFGIFKYAITLDGKIATNTGHSQWITSPTARNFVHHLRSACDAIIVGGNTIRKDNPQLTTHGVSDRNPLRIIMTKTFNLPLNCQLWNVNEAKTVIFTLPQPNSFLKSQLLDKGVEIIEIEDINPSHVMDNLYQRGFNTVLWECGGNLASTTIELGMIQKVYAFIAPKIIGGDGLSAIGNLNINTINDALILHDTNISAIGDDFLIEGYLPMKN